MQPIAITGICRGCRILGRIDEPGDQTGQTDPIDPTPLVPRRTDWSRSFGLLFLFTLNLIGFLFLYRVTFFFSGGGGHWQSIRELTKEKSGEKK